ncbi:hypothetical protein [Streptosporangium sp. KLBMP 9127]|nr:hypothetical protein [Streptosporangium sp. KLBMP 9127]
MQGSWIIGKAHYRCVFPRSYAQANSVDHPRSVYVREELIVEPLDAWLAAVFDPERLPETVRAMEEAQLVDDHRLAAVEAVCEAVAECERKLKAYRALVDAGSDPAVVAGWIAETEAKRKVERMRLDKAVTGIPRRLTEEEITAMMTMLGDLRKLLRSADPRDKAEAYGGLGLHLTYEPAQKTVIARTEVGRSCSNACPRATGDFRPGLPLPSSSSAPTGGAGSSSEPELVAS